MRFGKLLLALSLILGACAEQSFAAGKRSSSPSRGTGSKSSSTPVRSYTRSNGKSVQSYKRSTGDRSFSNNYSTKGNVNPKTGKAGTRVTPKK